MISIINATKKFGKLRAVDNLSLNIESGIYGLVGQNGAGKSTLFRLISGVYSLDEGYILVDDNVQTTREAKKLVFFLSDDPYVDRQDNISGMLSFYLNFYDINLDKFYSLIKKFELPTDKLIRGFSKGMKRQLFISLALSINAKYLLLDEAFDGIDPIVIESIKEELLSAKDEGKVIVASSHNVTTLEKLVDSFIMVTKGKLSRNEKNENIGENYVKYQILFKKDIEESQLLKQDIKVVSFKKYGSIYNVVVLEDEGIEEKIKNVEETILLERVPIDVDEIIKLNMILARKEIDHEDK